MLSIIEGRIINLRPVEEEDCELLRQWRNNPEVSYYLFTHDYITKEMQKRWYHNNIKNNDTNFYFVIERKEKPVGLIFINRMDRKNQRAEFGFYIPDIRDRLPGVALEAEYLIMEYAFDVLHLNKICCEVFKFNEPAITMHKKFGFTEEGMFRQHILHEGILKDVVYMGLLKTDFKYSKEKIRNLILRISKVK